MATVIAPLMTTAFWRPPPPSPPAGHLFVDEPLGGTLGLDLLILAMCVLVLLHASRNNSYGLALTGLVVGASIETASIRLGGTHCHASGLLDLSECSSLNSVLYYCLLYTSPSPRDRTRSRMPSSA